MATPRKIAIGVGATLALLVVLLLALPLLFRDRIEARLRAELARSLDARLDWDRVGLSALRGFPNVTLSLDAPSVVGVGRFTGDTLLAMRRARLVLDAASVYRHLTGGAAIVVREVALERPRARLQVLEDGTASWDIVRKTDGATRASGRAVGVTLRELRITDGVVTLDDRKARLAASVEGLHETLSGDFGQSASCSRRTRGRTPSRSGSRACPT